MATAEASGLAAMPRRDIRFDFSGCIPSQWCGGQPEFSHVANAFMQALPFLEPYFIHNIREAARHIHDAALEEQIAAYVSQEARHAQEHRRFSAVLRERYPELAPLEADLKARLERSRREDTLLSRMAYTAGYEAITYRMACFLMNKKDVWLERADPRVFGMLLWHMVEEVEHKSVAFDAFRSLNGGIVERWQGLYAATLMTVKDISAMARCMMEADGLLHSPESRRRLHKVVLGLARELLPGFRHYLTPWHHPSDCEDPPVAALWQAHYNAGCDLRVLHPQSPLLNLDDALDLCQGAHGFIQPPSTAKHAPH